MRFEQKLRTLFGAFIVSGLLVLYIFLLVGSFLGVIRHGTDALIDVNILKALVCAVIAFVLYRLLIAR